MKPSTPVIQPVTKIGLTGCNVHIQHSLCILGCLIVMQNPSYMYMCMCVLYSLKWCWF